MSVPARLIAFAAVLALAFGGAALAGDAIGPEPDRAGDAEHPEMDGGHESVHDVRGLSVEQDGLRLVVASAELPRDRVTDLRFRVTDEDGATVRDFEVEHERRMHVIVVRRDLTGFRHLHPEQLPDGSWAVRARIPAAGSYRLFADFSRGGEPHTLATDLRVDGPAELRDLPPAATTADAGDGYQVRREPGELHFTVTRDGEPVRVEPYLGAGGHLVALREGDLAFLHVHPTTEAGEAIAFEATFPTSGRYRLFLQFKHDGVVRTAAFTEEVR